MAIGYNPRIVTDGLVLCLDAANTKSYGGSGTTWTDLSGNGNDGTLTNGPTHTSGAGGYFTFDGSNDYVAVSNLGLSSNTLEGWINSHTNQGGNQGNDIVSALGYYSRVGAEKYTYIGFIGSNTLTFRIDDGSTSHKQVADVTYTTNQWYHVALSYNSSNGSTVAYVNGSSVGSTTATTGITFNNTPNDIARAENGRYFDGFVSTARIYDRALTAAEVAQNFNALRGRYGI